MNPEAASLLVAYLGFVVVTVLAAAWGAAWYERRQERRDAQGYVTRSTRGD